MEDFVLVIMYVVLSYSRIVKAQLFVPCPHTYPPTHAFALLSFYRGFWVDLGLLNYL